MKVKTGLLSLLIFSFTMPIQAQKAKRDFMQWKIAAELPALNGQAKSLGFAGPVAGVHNNVLIVAGGANFPGAMPWQGGKKKYYDDVYVLKKESDNTFSWLATEPLHLKNTLAYSGNLSLPNGILCIGGETETGHTNEVFLLQWNAEKKDIEIKSMPPLPHPLANTAVSFIGNTIYVAGGEDAQAALNTFYQLDLSASTPQWETLPPLPLALSHAVSVTQSNGNGTCIYVIGGRTKTASGISELHNTVFCFNPATKSWKQLGPVSDGKNTTNMSATNAVAYGENCILLAGGDKGNIFHHIETFNANIANAKTTEEKERLQTEKIQLLTTHPGFSKDVLLYNTVKDCWDKIGELPGYGPVTTNAVKWDDSVFIVSGEIKPGVRTPGILMGRLATNK